jgi:hypothetical protein
MKKLILITMLFLLFVFTSQAQDSLKGLSSRVLSIHSVSLGISWYNPSMDYWNNTFLPSTNSTTQFNGDILYTANISFHLPYNLGARVGAWYWQEKVTGTANASFNSLRVGFTGFSLGVFYHYPKPIIWGIVPYAGLEGSEIIIQNKYNVDETISKMRGYNLAGAPFIGIERVFFQKMILGIEYGYMFGGYHQDVETTSGTSHPWISINGSKIGLTVGYKFP